MARVNRKTRRGTYDRSQTTEERRAAKRHALLAAATTCFATHGTKTTVETIVAAASTSRRTFYQHFKSCEDVLEQVYELAARVALEVVAAPLRTVSDPLDAIRAAVGAYFRLLALHPDAAIVVFKQYRRLGAEQEARYQKDTAKYAALLREALSAAHASGQIAREPTELSVHVLVAGLEAAAIRSLDSGQALGPTQTEELSTLIISSFEHLK